ncbi:MAG: nicotinate-nucleotide--dimethylbenzimidazole phosphoribosyltransferase [Pseudomonadota bacterium]
MSAFDPTASAPFRDRAAVLAACDALPEPDVEAIAAAAARNDRLTKPAGALGRLERLALWTAGWRQDPRPRLDRAQILIFAGDHGVAARGVSPYPSEVTAQMVANFETGGAAINQLARLQGASLTVRALNVGRPTADLSRAPAMTEADLLAALNAGWASVDPAADAICLGEMGIGNTTAAAALSAALFGGRGADWAGRGAGLDDAGLAQKAGVVDEALALHGDALADPLEALRRLGGQELAALAGATLRARHLRRPVLLDGFICTAAVAPLARLAPGALAHCLAGHRSVEPGHGRLLEALGLEPLLDLDLRLGEGSGAAIALGVLRAALACQDGMATFEEAGVSDRD